MSEFDDTTPTPDRGAPAPQNLPAQATATTPVAEPTGGKKKKAKDKNGDKLGSRRGIETMFRTSYRVHMDLSSLADAKANIMISINGIIISIIIASISPKIDANPWLLLPTSIMLLGSLISIVYAVLAARPRVSSSTVDLNEFKTRKNNILFFGHYVSMPEEDYVEGMTELMNDQNALYHNMIRDIYGLGRVLDKKFALLRTSYTTFMIGLILGILSFITVYVWVVTIMEPETFSTVGL